MKTGFGKPNFLCNFSQLLLSNISLCTVLFTADVGLPAVSLRRQIFPPVLEATDGKWSAFIKPRIRHCNLTSVT